MTLNLDSRPIIVALAGPNGAGKTTFYEAYLRHAGLRFVNADVVASELAMPPYQAAEMAARIRAALVARRESFVFETVFSDPIGEKVAFLRDAAAGGYAVVLCFIGLESADTSDQRVAQRVLQGGHDVLTEKLVARFARTLGNLQRAIPALPMVYVFDNSDLNQPFRKVAQFENGNRIFAADPYPTWLQTIG